MADKDKMAKYRTEIQQVCTFISAFLVFFFDVDSLLLLLFTLALYVSHLSFS